MDLIIRRARLRNRDDLVDLAFEGGRIAAIAKSVGSRAAVEIDAGGTWLPRISEKRHQTLLSLYDQYLKTGGLPAVTTPVNARINEIFARLEGWHMIIRCSQIIYNDRKQDGAQYTCLYAGATRGSSTEKVSLIRSTD